ncbi:homoserine acetyltransferase, partial [Xanthomonas translucens pv. translucens]
MSFVNTPNRPLDAHPALDRYAADVAPAADGVIAMRGEVAVALPLRHAGVQLLRLRYELSGPADAPVVFVAGGISAH